MTVRGWTIFGVVGWLVTIVGGVGAIAFRIARPTPIPTTTFGLGDAAIVAIVILGITWASVGALLVVRRPDNSVGRYMILAGAGYALSMVTGALTFAAAADGSEAARGTAAVAGWLTVVLSWVGGLAFLSLGFIFPTGRGHARAWDRLRRPLAVIVVVTTAVLLSQPGPLLLFPEIDNPFGFGPDLRVTIGNRALPITSFGLAIAAVAVMLAIVSRYRLAGWTERQQLKWFLWAIGASSTGLIVAGLGAVASAGPPGEAPLIAFGLAGTTVPVAIGIAILRNRLYDIDRIITRTLGYAVVSGLLGGVFVLAVLAISTLLGALAQGQTFAVAGSTLLVFALFGPARRRAQAVIDRRFDRSRYDADQTVRAFAGRLRNDIDLASITHEVMWTADAAVRPTKAAVWLRGTPR
jgi:hypothetical protein